MQADWALGTGQVLGAHTGTGSQRTHATEAEGYRKWDIGWVKGTAYVMPDWAGRMASILYILLHALLELQKNSSV